MYPTKQAIRHEREYFLREAHNYYCALGNYFNWQVDTVYENTIIDLIGSRGFDLIRKFNLIEPCGHKLYAL